MSESLVKLRLKIPFLITLAKVEPSSLPEFGGVVKHGTPPGKDIGK